MGRRPISKTCIAPPGRRNPVERGSGKVNGVLTPVFFRPPEESLGSLEVVGRRTRTFKKNHSIGELVAPRHSEGRLRSSNQILARKKQSGRPDAGGPDSEMERMWSKRNGRQPNSLGTSSMTHGWVLPPAFALWYSHRSESRSDSRDATVVRRHQNASLNPTRRAGSMRGRSLTLLEHGELQTPASGSIDPRALFSPIISSSRRHSPRTKLCMRPSCVPVPKRATGFAITRTGRGAARRWGALWWLWLAVNLSGLKFLGHPRGSAFLSESEASTVNNSK